jgi:2-methylaconitate cis-trans-isomerase PrpF
MRAVVLRRLTSSCLVAAAAALVAIPATSAKDGDVLVRGTCTSASSSKLKLSPEDGRIEVEFEVDQNRNGVRWTVSLRRPTRVVFRGTRITRAPSGSFELRRVVSDTAGSDRLTARATSPSGEVCRATAAFS